MPDSPDQDEPRTDQWGWTTDAAGNAVPPLAPAGEPTTAETAAVASSPRGGGLRSRRRHGRGGWGSSRRLALVGAAAVVVLAALGFGGYALASSHSPAKRSDRGGTTAPTSPPARVVPVTSPVHKATTCPLTGLPAPGGVVPQRPVLAVKVGNDPAARPQSGLQHADVVFDTLAEGGITRYIAVYQCNTAPSVGPIRSVRWDDWHILQMFGHADLAFVHGIDPDVQTVQSIPWICDLDAFAHFSLYTTNPDRYAPEATYASTASLWSGCRSEPAPPPIFHFAATPPATATPLAEAALDYSYAADVVWKWSAAHAAFLHYYLQNGALVPDVDDQGDQLQAKNVVIERVAVTYGAYVETPGGTGDVESQTAGAGGTAYVLSGGRIQRGTWSRPTWSDITQLIGADGKPMTLQPGNTWVEYVPTTDSVALTP